VEVVIEMPFERIAKLKISEGRTHPMGASSGQLLPIAPHPCEEIKDRLTKGIRKVNVINVNKGNANPTSSFMVHKVVAIFPNYASYNY
jgi:hypothetical protein